MAPKRFLDLPEDLHHLVISFVIRPTDRVSLCLTCKHLHQLTVRELYRTVDLDLGGEKDARLPALLNPGNIGLKWVKQLELYNEKVVQHPEERDLQFQARQSKFAINMLLEMLPRDQLELFRWHPWEVFSAENMALLLRKQRRLKWFGAIGLDKPWDEALSKKVDLAGALSCATKLGLYPDTRDSIEFCNAVLKQVKYPDKITLHCNFELDEEAPEYVADVNDGPTEPGLLTRTLFRHMLPFSTCTPMALRALTLEGVTLRYCLSTYCKVIDFTKVRKLSVCSCKSADALLAALCHSSRLPEKLDKFEFKNDDDEDECEVTSALDTFLCLVTGIKSMCLDVCGTKRLPSAMAIVRHAKTLEFLNAHAWKSKGHSHGSMIERVWDAESFEKITKACKRIEQLSIAFPTTYIGHRNTDEFNAFSVCLGNLPNLITCNLTTWPLNKGITSSSQQIPRKMYESLLQAEAQEGFETSIANATRRAAEAPETPSDPTEPRWTTSKVRVIAFGISDKVFDRDDSQSIFVFVRGQSLDPLGGVPKVQALKIDMQLRKFYEPRTDILEVPLSSQPPPPIREIETEDVWD